MMPVRASEEIVLAPSVPPFFLLLRVIYLNGELALLSPYFSLRLWLIFRWNYRNCRHSRHRFDFSSSPPLHFLSFSLIPRSRTRLSTSPYLSLHLHPAWISSVTALLFASSASVLTRAEPPPPIYPNGSLDCILSFSLYPLSLSSLFFDIFVITLIFSHFGCESIGNCEAADFGEFWLFHWAEDVGIPGFAVDSAFKVLHFRPFLSPLLIRRERTAPLLQKIDRNPPRMNIIDRLPQTTSIGSARARPHLPHFECHGVGWRNLSTLPPSTSSQYWWTKGSLAS